MSSFDLAGFSEIMGELRVARPAAPEGLRAQVLALGEPVPRRQRSFRKPALLLAPAGLAAAAVAAVAIGVVQSGGGSKTVARGEARALKAAAPSAAAREDSALPAPGVRAKRYEAELTLRVHNLSAQTKRALHLTRSLGGYVRSVDYGQGQKAGTAYLVVRVPVERVQQAILRFSALGAILDQHVSIQDVQPALDRRYLQIQALRRQITALEGQSSPEAQAKLTELNRQLVALQREQAEAIRATSFATVSLSLRTEARAVTPPARPGRIERTFDRAGTVLLQELAVLVYVVVVALPLLLLVAAAYFAARSLRRRSLDRLLENS